MILSDFPFVTPAEVQVWCFLGGTGTFCISPNTKHYNKTPFRKDLEKKNFFWQPVFQRQISSSLSCTFYTSSGGMAHRVMEMLTLTQHHGFALNAAKPCTTTALQGPWMAKPQSQALAAAHLHRYLPRRHLSHKASELQSQGRKVYYRQKSRAPPVTSITHHVFFLMINSGLWETLLTLFPFLFPTDTGEG